MFVARFFKALAALIATGILAAGTPVVLVWLAGWPLPDHIPSNTDVKTWLSTAPTDQTLIDAIAILGWLAWAWFLLSLIAEATATSLDQPQGATRMNPLRWAAAALVGAITASATSLAAHAHPNTAVTTIDNRDTPPEADRLHATKIRTDSSTDYRVQVDDNLWDIADDELGSGTKSKTIFAASKNRVQPDGARLTDPNLIRPGWILTIPRDDDSDSDTTDHPKPEPPSPPAPSPDESTKPTKPTPSQPETATANRTSNSDAADQHGGIPVGVAIGASLVPVTVIAGVVYFVRASRRRARDYQTRTGKPGPEMSFKGSLDGLEALASHELDVGINVPAAFAHTAADEPIAVTDIAAAGIGLTGPGGNDAARAAIATLITVGDDDHEGAQTMVIATSDLIESLSTNHEPNEYTSWVRLFTVPDVGALHRRLTVDSIARRRHHEKTDHTGCDCPTYTTPLVVVAQPDTPHETRELAAILNQANDLGIYGIILGDWPDKTIHVAQDGTTDDPHIHRCYQLDADIFTDLLDTLTTADRTYDPPITDPDNNVDYDDDTSGLTSPRIHATTPSHFHSEENEPAAPTDSVATEQQPIETSHTASIQHGHATPEPEPAPPDSTVRSDDTSINTDSDEPPATVNESPGPDGSLRLTLLGDTQILHYGQPVRFRRSRSLDLIAYLATQHRPVPVKDVQTDIVGHIISSKARKHLNAVITDTRRDLRQCTDTPEVDFIVFTNNHYRLETEWFTTDIDEFDQHLNAAETATDPTERTSHLTAALDLCTGDFGTGLDDEAFWTQPLRTHYRDRAYTAALQLAEHHANTDTPNAVKALEHAISINPHPEEAFTRLITLHTETGATEAARRARQRLATRRSTK